MKQNGIHWFNRSPETDHDIIDITMSQVHQYAGNLLQVESKDDVLYTLLSQSAFDSFTHKQKQQFAKHTQLLPVSIPAIETVGGGSVRCMMAEIFLEKKPLNNLIQIFCKGKSVIMFDNNKLKAKSFA